jgi:hypothetical protein
LNVAATEWLAKQAIVHFDIDSMRSVARRHGGTASIRAVAVFDM